jgi:hypothetical protein
LVLLGVRRGLRDEIVDDAVLAHLIAVRGGSVSAGCRWVTVGFDKESA